MKIYVNTIDYLGSVVDGPGVRTVVYLQGCDINCLNCHNKTTWDIEQGKSFDIDYLIVELRNKVENKKITISGGEPLLQYEALLLLVKQLFDFDICLYTGHEFEEVERDCGEVLQYLKYIKVGKYKKELRCSTEKYIGSSNQKFIELNNGVRNGKVEK